MLRVLLRVSSHPQAVLTNGAVTQAGVCTALCCLSFWLLCMSRAASMLGTAASPGCQPAWSSTGHKSVLGSMHTLENPHLSAG